MLRQTANTSIFNSALASCTAPKLLLSHTKTWASHKSDRGLSGLVAKCNILLVPDNMDAGPTVQFSWWLLPVCQGALWSHDDDDIFVLHVDYDAYLPSVTTPAFFLGGWVFPS